MDSNTKLQQYANTNVRNICYELFQAIKNIDSFEEEIFTILALVSSHISHLLPLPYDAFSINDASMHEKKDESVSKAHLKHLKYVLDELELFFVSKVKNSFCIDVKSTSKVINASSHNDFQLSDQQLNSVCSNIAKLQVIIGNKQTEEKFCNIVTKCMDSLLQHHDLYDSNAYTNLSRLTQQFLSLFKYTKVLIKHVIYVLTCAQICKSKGEKLSFLQETILEKLTLQLLTLSGSVKKSFLKLFSKNKSAKNEESSNNTLDIQFGGVSLSLEEPFLTVEALCNFALVIKQFLSLESWLESFNMLNVDDYKNLKTKKGVLKHQSLELPDLIKTSHHLSFPQSLSKFTKWSWCETLQEFAPILGNSIVNCLKITFDKLMLETKECYRLKNASSLKCVASSYRAICNPPDGTPKLCYQFIERLLDLVVKLLPLSVIGGKHRFLSKLKTDFVDIVNQVIKDLKPFILDLIEDTPEKNCLSVLPQLLASCQDIILILQFCDQKLRQDHRLPFHGTIQIYKSLCNHLEQFILQYQKSRLCTVILHDAESNYWSDPRSFGEDARCSYSVEMWQPFLLKLHRELFEAVDYKTCQKIVSEVFCDSLCILANRYCNCSPSSNRHNQVRRDIVEILHFAYNFMWKIQTKPHDICPFSNIPTMCFSNITFKKIHTACQDLFTCLNILTTPLDTLHDIVALLATYERQGLLTCSWLSFVDPLLFPVGWNGTSKTLSDLAFVCCILNYMKESSDENFHVAYEAISARNELLLNVIKENQDLQSLHLSVVSSLTQVEVLQEAVSMNLCLENNPNSATESEIAYADFDFFSSEKSSCLPWQSVLCETLVIDIENSLAPAIDCLSLYCLSSSGKSLCKRLPAEVSASIPGIYSDDADEIVHICTSLVFQGLCAHALSLPDFVVALLIRIDEQVTKSSSVSSLCFGSYGAHALLHVAHQFLSDTKLLGKHFGSDLSSTVIAAVAEVARFLLQIESEIKEKNGKEEDCTWKVLLNEVDAYKECTHMLFSHVENQELIKTSFDSSELVYSLKSGIISDKNVKSLKDLYQLLNNNFDHLTQHLLTTSNPGFQGKL